MLEAYRCSKQHIENCGLNDLPVETSEERCVVFDIGANTGFYTLLASVLVGPQGRVFAFEPVPLNLRYLNEHLRLNNIKNVSVIDAAVAECAEEANVPFHCFKAISDAHDARLPDMNEFSRNGQFSAWRFIAHIAVRPGLWRVVSDMSKASLDSRDALCKHLENWIAERASADLKRETSKIG